MAPYRRHLDFLTGEKSGLGLRQDGWYRFAHAFQAELPSCLIEDPTTHVLKIVADLKRGRTDAYTLMMMEPLAFGCNMAVPYGAWLINRVPDAMYPDMAHAAAMGDWLTAHADLFGGRAVADVAIVYDQRAAREISLFVDPERDKDRHTPFHRALAVASEAGASPTVVYVSDDEPLVAARFAKIGRVLLPDCDRLTEADRIAMDALTATGGKSATLGRINPSAATDGHHEDTATAAAWLLAGVRTVRCTSGGEAIGFQLRRTGTALRLHIVNYALDRATRTVTPLDRVVFELDWAPRFVSAVGFPDDCELRGRTLTVRGLGIYTVVELSLW